MEALMRDRKAWIVVGMMFFFMLINFADKAVIGLAAVPIMTELKLTNAEFGKLGSAFFLLFSISAVLVGFLVNHVKTKWVLAVSALIWALTQLPMMFTVSFSTLLVSRVILGAGEGPAYPVALHAVYKWFENGRRTVPTSLVSIGAAIGTGVAAPAITWIIVNFDWHAAFGALALIGFIWVAAWVIIGEEGPLGEPAEEAGTPQLQRVPYWRLLTSRSAVGVLIAGFSAYWALTLAVVWLPAYLTKGAGFSATQASWIVALPSLTQIVFSPSMGALSQWLLARGVSSRKARGVLGGACVALAGLAMIGLPLVIGGPLQFVFVMAAFASGSVIYTLGPALIGEISPVAQRGAMLGISNAFYTLAGLLAPWIMGMIVDVGANPKAGFGTGFQFAGLLILAGGLAAMLLIDPKSDLARFKREPTSPSFPRSGEKVPSAHIG
ncbi:MAG: MFS transporter [Hyphomicrobiales bacterium]|nr:MFS transporter [Hyphomicrobiales bacterium]MBV9432313.1 MFS transporter [Hyphomicrobiales bacterium]MBW0002473.1 MFS transporter [Hyphomicrobiales bacterium]